MRLKLESDNARSTTGVVHAVVARKDENGGYRRYTPLCNSALNLGIHGFMYGWKKTHRFVDCEHCLRRMQYIN